MLNRFLQRLLNPLPMEETEQDYQDALQPLEKPRVTWQQAIQMYDFNPNDPTLREEFRRRYDIVDEE